MLHARDQPQQHQQHRLQQGQIQQQQPMQEQGQQQQHGQGQQFLVLQQQQQGAPTLYEQTQMEVSTVGTGRAADLAVDPGLFATLSDEAFVHDDAPATTRSCESLESFKSLDAFGALEQALYNHLQPAPAQPAEAAQVHVEAPADGPLAAQMQHLMATLAGLGLPRASNQPGATNSFTCYDGLPLGKGSFASVYPGWYGGPVAVKVLDVDLGAAAQLDKQEELFKELEAHVSLLCTFGRTLWVGWGGMGCQHLVQGTAGRARLSLQVPVCNVHYMQCIPAASSFFGALCYVPVGLGQLYSGVCRQPCTRSASMLTLPATISLSLGCHPSSVLEQN